ncbi:MAG: hypothetical protein ACLFR5_03745 [Halobacteriales archaeon]
MTTKIPEKAYLVLLLCAVLITTGCLQEDGVGAEDIREASAESMDEVDTYAFETETDVEAQAGGGTEDSLSLTVFTRGTASESADRMKTSSNHVVNEETVDQETYAENGTAYVRLRNGGDGETGGWLERGNASSTPVDHHVGILRASEAEYEGEESIDNESAHVLTVGADTKEFRAFVLRTAEVPLENAGVVTETLLDDAEFGNASLRYWVSDDTDRLLRAEATANVSVTVPNAEEELEIQVETETEFSSYGGEVNLTAPSGIENAAERDDGFSGSSSGSAGAAAYASEGGVVDVMEVRHSESGGNETSTATVTTNPVTADKVTAEAVESGDTATAQNLNESREEFVLELDPDGDEVVVRVTRGNETEVVYNQTVSPE